MMAVPMTVPNFTPAIPEIFVLSMACLLLVIDLFRDQSQRHKTYQWSLITLLGAAVLTVWGYSDQPQITFSGAFINDGMGAVLKLFIYLTIGGAFIYSFEYLKVRQLLSGEYFILGLLGVLGMMIMVSAHSLLAVYLGLELLSLCLYTMVALDRDSGLASEAAMKYFVLGALASGILLYGLSLLYGATGSLDIAIIAGQLTETEQPADLIVVFGLVFILIGLAFKLGVAPFHMWVPDVYQGSPTAVTIYLASAPKIAAFALLMRVFVDGLGSLQADWQPMLMALAVLSMAIGNVVAIAQTNIKRMLAYSTIAHAGFLLLGLIAGTTAGYAAAMFYVLVYAVMGLGAFGIILLLSRAGFEADQLEDLKGLNERNPWFAFIMLILIFSMAGVPPTLGFYAKLSVLKAVVDVQMVWLAVTAVIFSIIGAFYYLRVIRYLYFEAPDYPLTLTPRPMMTMALSLNGLAILALGIYPSGLMSVCFDVLK